MVNFKQMVEQVIDVEGIKRGEYLIRPSFYKELEELKESMDEIEEQMNKELKRASKELKLDNLKLEFVAHHGYHFRITLQNESVIRKHDKYVILDAVKSGVRFISDKLSDLNTSFTDVRNSYEEQQKSVVEEVIRVARKRFTF